MKKIVAFVLIAVMAAGFAACSPSTPTSNVDTYTINFLNWGEYIDPDLISEFETEFPNIKVKMTTVGSNEEMYTVCATEGSQIDIVVISDYMVERFIKENLLGQLDLTAIPNINNIMDYAKTRTFDSEVKWSAPYMYGTVGIVYNKSLVDDEVDSWDILWNEKFEKQIMMYDSVRDSMMVALIKLGYDLNTTDKAQLEAAGQLLLEQKKLVLAYGTDDIKDAMAAGNVALAVDYSGAAAAAIMENEDLGYVVPKEGSNIWVDNLVILKATKNKSACETFINFLLDSENAARNSTYIGYSNPDPKAMDALLEEYPDNPAIEVTPEQISRCKYYVDLGENIKSYNDVWMKVKTAG